MSEVVETIELVVAALSAGAAAGVTNTASAAVTDAYEGLKTLARRAVGVSDAQLEAPVQHRAELVAALTAAKADEDAELVEAARKVLNLVESAKYVIDVHDNKGVQVGEGNTMTLNFNDK